VNYKIVHRTVYEYTAPVSVSHHVARLEPRGTPAQERGEFRIEIAPAPALRKARTDYFGNQLCFFSIQEAHEHLEITTTSRISVHAVQPPAAEASPTWEETTRLFRDPVSPEVVEPYQFVFDSQHVRAAFDYADYAQESFPKDRPLLAGVTDLTRRIHRDFQYDPQATTVATQLEEVMKNRRGVCQDFAHMGIACLRSLGLPARYVSGYLRTHAPEGRERLVGADASHAWFAVWCPGAGWWDFDPTNDVQPGEEHITIAFGRDFGDVSPVAGIITGGGQHDVLVSVDVAEIPPPA
jgi:transglutaminase-like putative cysteine protease